MWRGVVGGMSSGTVIRITVSGIVRGRLPCMWRCVMCGMSGRVVELKVAMRDWPRQIVLQMEVREVGQRGGTLGDGCLLDRLRQGVSVVL